MSPCWIQALFAIAIGRPSRYSGSLREGSEENGANQRAHADLRIELYRGSG